MRTAALLPFAVWAFAALSVAQGAQFVVRSPAVVASQHLFKVVAADFDGDGDLDLCAAAQAFSVPSPLLLRNDGAERFTDVCAGQPGVPFGWLAQSVAPFDVDGDSDVDLFLLASPPRRGSTSATSRSSTALPACPPASPT